MNGEIKSGKTLSKYTRELLILNRIAEALNREVDLNDALQVALARIAELFNLTTGWIFLLDPTTGKFYTAATLNLPPALADHPRRLGGTCHCLDTYTEGDMDGAANINAIACTRLKDLREGTEGLRYHASIPLYARDEKLGVLNVASTDWEEIAEDDLHLLHTVADLVSMAIQRARLFFDSAQIGAINERNRLAREIHDTIAQGLAAIALKLEEADTLLETGADREAVHRRVQDALSITRTNIEEARRSVMDLRAAPLEGYTLPEALERLLDSTPIQTHLSVEGSAPPLNNRISVGLYRIAQEAINNVIQHADAADLWLRLLLMPDRVRLIIEDNGRGFDTRHVEKGRFGIVGMHERVRLLDGRIDIASEPDAGTTVEVMIPLVEKADVHS